MLHCNANAEDFFFGLGGNIVQIGLYLHNLAETIVSEDCVQANERSTVSPGQQETTDRLFNYWSDPVTAALVL